MSEVVTTVLNQCTIKCDNGGRGVKNDQAMRDVTYGFPFPRIGRTWLRNIELGQCCPCHKSGDKSFAVATLVEIQEKYIVFSIRYRFLNKSLLPHSNLLSPQVVNGDKVEQC